MITPATTFNPKLEVRLLQPARTFGVQRKTRAGMKQLSLTIGCLLALSTLSAEEDQFVGAPEGQVYIYKQDGDTPREIEIFFPKDHDPETTTVPGIIMFHGGGWGGGHRKQFRSLCHYFSTRGLVAATVTYQLAAKAGSDEAKGKGTGSRKRVCITDAKSAIRWCKQNADGLGIDPRRIIAGGGSAGGHISLLATTNPGLNDPRDPEDYDTTVVAYLLFNPALSAGDSQDSEVDFLQHVGVNLSPAIVFFGSEDKWLKNGWKAAGAKVASLDLADSVEVRIADGQDHGFFNKEPWMDITLIAADRFLHDLGYLKGEPTLSLPATGEKLKDLHKTVDPAR
ncbi:MAG: alpha/beta hydrolase fold domain-containing protein [Verrucomicrobiota bacterium]